MDKYVCHYKSDALMEEICDNERLNCPNVPSGSNPIKPIGNCCFECGAIFQMKLDSPNNFNLKTFKAAVSKAVDATSVVDANKIVFHISVVASKDRQHYLQLIIVDRFEYDELSTRLMEFLRQSMLDARYEKQSKFYFVSGMRNESGHVLAFIFGSFFLVTLFMTVIYAVYYDDRHIPRFMAAIRNRRFLPASDVTFARFDNTSQAFAGDNSIAEVDLHFGTDQSIENINSAFNNPMFEGNIGVEGETTRKTLEEVELKAD